MSAYIILFLTNLGYIVFRAFEIRAVSGNKPLLAALSQAFLTLIWLVTVSFGLKSVIENDYFMWAAYIVSASLGTAFGTRIRRPPQAAVESASLTEAQLKALQEHLLSTGKFAVRSETKEVV